MRIRSVVVGTVVLLSPFGMHAQALVATVAEAGVETFVVVGQQPTKERKVTLSLERTTLPEAIDAIASAGNVDIAYSKATLGTSQRVNVTIRNATVREALQQVLAGTGFATTTYGGKLAVVEAGPASQTVQNGSITGKVIHAKTRQPVAGATILLGDETKGVVTGSDGTFRIPARVGEHRVTVRAVGFGRVVKSVTVRTDESSAIEIVLEPSASVLDEVIVTGTVVATERKAIPNPITVITAEDIEKRGITRIEQFLRGEVPGVVAIEQGALAFQDRSSSSIDNLGGAVTAQVYSRGSSGLNWTGGSQTPLKTFVDGVELLDGSYLGTIDPQSIERIEIVTGPQAATIYGSGAMGGVMQIFTKKGAAGRAPEYTLNLRYGMLESNLSNGKTPSHRHSFGVTGSDGPSLSYSASVSYDYSGQWQPNVFSRRTGGSLGVNYRRDRMTVNGSFSTTGTNNGTTGYSSGANLSPKGRQLIESGQWKPVSTASTFSKRLSKSSNQTVSLNVDYRVSQEWQHQLTLGRSGNQFSVVPEAPGFYTTVDTLYRNSTAGGQRTSWSYNSTYATNRMNWFSPTLTVGANGATAVQTRSQGCVGTKTATSYVGCTATTAPNVTQTINDNSWGGFGNFRMGFFDQLYLTFGLRAEKNPNYGQDHAIDWTPTNGITYTNSIGDLTIKFLASYGSATRPPIADRRLEVLEVSPNYDPPNFIRQFANPELRPEYSRGPQGGVELYYGRWGAVTINHYQQKVTDLLQRVPVDTFRYIYLSTGDSSWTNQYQWLNVGSVRQYGWEGTAAVSVGALNVKGTYSWNDSRILANDPRLNTLNTVGRSFNNVLTHTGSLIVSYAHGKTSATTSTSFVGKTLVAGLDRYGDAFVYYDRSQTREPMYYQQATFSVGNYSFSKPGYTKTDLAVSHQMTPWASAVVNIVNVGNNYTSDVWASAGWPSLGRQTTIGLSLRYR